MVQQGVIKVRAKRKKMSRPAVGQDQTTVDLRAFDWVSEVVPVRAGQQSRLRRGYRPAAPRGIDMARTVAWKDKIVGETTLFADGFDLSPLNQWPKGWHKPVGRTQPRWAFVVLEVAGPVRASALKPTSAEQQARNNLGGRMPTGKILWVQKQGSALKIYYSPVKSWNLQKVTGSTITPGSMACGRSTLAMRWGKRTGGGARLSSCTSAAAG